jgi:hypothetical protein
MWQFSSTNEPFEDALVALRSCRLCFEKLFMHFFVFNVFWNIVAFLPLQAFITCCNFWMSLKVLFHRYVFLVACHMVLRFWVWESFRCVVVIFIFLVFECHDFGSKLFIVSFTYQDLFQSGHYFELKCKFEVWKCCLLFPICILLVVHLFWLLLVNWMFV